jgi:hypothetical protein
MINPAPDAPTRRGLLRGAGLAIGAAAVAVPAFAGVAAAQEGTDTTVAGGTDTTVAGGTDTTAAEGGDTTAAPATSTTTTPPRRPEPADIDVLTFAQSLELAAVAAYGEIVDSGQLDEEMTNVARLFQRHHQEHADAFAGMAGSAAPNEANAAYLDELSASVADATDQTALLQVALDIENRAAAFYIAALEDLVALEPAALVASIVPIDGRHAVVLARAIGLQLEDYVPDVQTADEAPTPADYPLDED